MQAVAEETAQESAQEPAQKAARILLVDDHPIVREGLTRIINRQSDMLVCAEAGSVAEALKKVLGSDPDLVIMDLTLDGSLAGLELIKAIAARFPGLPTLVHSMHDEQVYAERVLKAGARGYVTKASTLTTLLAAIREVRASGLYLSESVSATVMRRYFRGEESGEPSVSALSNRELEVFAMETHRSNIKEKLSLPNSAALMKRAVQWVLENK